MTVYTINENKTFGSLEISFDGKPSEKVREALKSIKFRWNPKKSIWYGYAKEHDVINTIINADSEAIANESAVITDGYLGGGAIYGNKSNLCLYGADRAKAFREEFKRAGIKNISVRTSKSTYIDSYNITFKLPRSAYVSVAEFVTDYKINWGKAWTYYKDGEKTKEIYTHDIPTLSPEEQERVRQGAAVYEYTSETKEIDINHYHLESHKVFTSQTLEVIKKIKNIVEAYRYDESSSMVDYFDTNFYYSITVKPCEEI